MYSLLPCNTFGIDIGAVYFLEYSSVEELKKLIVQGAATTPFLHIGGGDNLLFTRDHDGLILYPRIEGIEMTREDGHSVSIRVGVGVVWDDLVVYCVGHGWYGTENPSLIPGKVGADAVQSIGAYGVEAKDLITAVETMNVRAGERVCSVEECGCTYRNSISKHSENKSAFVTYVRFRLSKKEYYMLDYGIIRQELEKYLALTLSVIRKVIINIRESKLPDPKVVGNAGSFFIDPIVLKERLEALQQEYPRISYYELADGRVKIPTGWMIDQCGWKGKALGPVVIHDKQALVLANLGGAKDSDILALSGAVRALIHERFDIDTHPKVNLIN